jgi:peroxiredoxin
MRTLWLLMAVISMGASAQTPQELIRLAQDAYRNPTGYELGGKGLLQPVGSSWQVRFPITIVAAPAPLETPNAPVSPVVRFGGPLEFTKTSEGSNEKPKSISFPFVVAGAWSRIAENTASVKEIGSERLPLNGELVDCRVLEVEYNPLPDDTKLHPVKYSICSDKHLALKKVMLYSMGRRPTDPEGLWTITLDTVQFHRPAPKWLLDLNNQPKLKTRKEWQGREAPSFKLADLDGQKIESSTMRGKLVLLDFWSTSCAPCLREMPTIQSVAKEHKDDLIVWGISLDQAERDKKWLAQHQEAFPTLTDSDYVVSDLYKVQGIPAVVLIDRKGKIRNYWEGEVAPNDLEAALKRAALVR